jgi:hypothetical protein
LWMLSRSSQNRNLFVLMHVLLFIVLFNILHLVTLLTADSLSTSIASYFLTTLITVGYVAMFTSLPISVSRLCVRTQEVLDCALRATDKHLLIVFLCWAATKSYLVSKYGVSTFFVYRQLAGDERIVYREFLDATLETVTETLAIGGIVFFVIRLAIIRGYLKRLKIVLPSMAFLSVYLGLGETSLGSRRFLFLLAVVGVASLVQSSSGQFAKVLLERWKLVVLVALLVGGASIYYQTIRTNRENQEIAVDLLSPNLLDVGRGVMHALLPAVSDEEPTEATGFFREGPFELVLVIMESLTDLYKPMGGELTYSSVQMAIPRAILGEDKISVNVDEIMAERFDIDTGPDSLTTDLAKNLLAIFIADYGVPGAALAPIVVLLVLVWSSMALRALGKKSTVASMFLTSLLFLTAASVQTDLIGVLSLARSLVAFLFVWMLVTSVGRVFRRYANRKSR